MIDFSDLVYFVINEGKREFIKNWLDGRIKDFDMDMILLENKRNIEKGKIHMKRNDP